MDKKNKLVKQENEMSVGTMIFITLLISLAFFILPSLLGDKGYYYYKKLRKRFR